MKYGEALPQRSVLEWRAFNLDYNEICNLIKKNTLGRIPVSNPNLKTEFDDELFDVLVEQLERIELFVKSKAGEIDRRIVQCQKAITALYERDKSNSLSSKRLARYVKAEAEVERALYDTQNLSRFSKAQYTGFKKLLKKYKKWTGSSCVIDRFTPMLESPTAFHNRDFEHNVLILSELLAAVRSKYNDLIEASQRRDTDGNPPVENGILSTLRGEEHSLRTYADIDMALGTNSPSNPSFASGKGGKAIYWVHNDHIVEIQVLLLKYLNIQTSQPGSTLPPTPALSRRPSATGLSSITWVSEKVEDVGTVILDDLPKFAQAQSSKTIEQASETGPAVKIRWCGNDKDAEASIMINSKMDDSGYLNDNESGYYTLTLKRKYIENLINIDIPLTFGEDENINTIRNWFQTHPDITPLVKILARRTRFVSGNKIWAVLDRDVRMYRLGEDWYGSISDPSRETGMYTVFPHAVLEVRWEGHEVPSLVAELNKSHLLEPVPGFSLDVHAVAVMHEPKEMATPFWIPALSRDIRKTPSRPFRHSRQPSANTIYRASSGPSVCSIPPIDYTDASLESSGTLVTPPNEYTDSNSIKKKKKSLSWGKQSKPLHSIDHSWLGGERYWSEFNDENENEPYTILIHPQSADSEPTGCLGKLSEDLKRFFNFHEDSHLSERMPLISDLAQDSSDEDLEAGRGQVWRYDTFTSQQEEIRERRLFRGYCLNFAASVLILIVAGSWALTHSPKKKDGPNMNTSITETVAVFGAAVLAGYAVSLFVARKTPMSMLHKSIVLGLFFLICLMGSLILSIVYNNWLGP